MSKSISTMSGKIKVKLVFLGNQAVGKSSIIEKYIHNKFDETSNTTVGIDFLAKNVSHKAKNYRLQLWDTAGQQRFRSLIPNYLKDAQCALIVYDVTNVKSLQAVQTWLNLYNQNQNGDGICFLIGNKVDLDRQVSTEDGKKVAQAFNMGYCQISAKTGQNLVEMFMTVLETISEKANAPHPTLLAQKKEETIKQQKQQEQTGKPEQKSVTDETHAKIRDQSQQNQNKGIVLQNPNIEKTGSGKKAKNGGCC